MRIELDKTRSSSSAHFRSKLLHAVEQMQSALGIQDLGQFHYQPLRDSEGTTVLVTCRQIHDPKLISSLSVRWMPLNKLLRKLFPSAGSSPENSDSSLGFTLAGELLLQSLTVSNLSTADWT